MPLYEYLCPLCGARDEIFLRRLEANVTPPPCPKSPGAEGHDMRRVVSRFARHKTVKDQISDAEAKWGAQIDAAMGPEPDVGHLARRYEQHASGLPTD